MKSLFLPQLLILGALLLLTLVGLELQPLVVALTAALILLWLAGAMVEPFSLLLSALALAGTTSTLSLLHISGLPFSVNGLLTAGLGAACALAIVMHFRQQFGTAPQLRRWLIESAPLSFLLAWAIVRTPGAPVLSDAISDVLIWSAVLALYILARAYWIEHPQALMAGEKAFLYVALLPLAMIVIDALLGNVFFNTTDRTLSPGLHTTAGSRAIPAFFGLALVPLLARVRFGQFPRRMSRRVLLGLIAVLAMWVYFSLGRTALLGAAGVVIPMMLLAPRSLWKAVVIVVVGVGLTAAVIQTPIYPRPTSGSLGDVITVGDKDADSETDDREGTAAGEDGLRVSVNTGVLRGITFGRTAVWEYLVERAVEENPLFGFGTGAARDASKDVIPAWDNPHNDYVRVFYDLGAVGLLILIVSWAARLLTCWLNWVRLGPDTQAGLYNLAAVTAGGYILLNFLTDNFIVYFFIMAPFALLLAMATASTVRAEVRKEATVSASGAQPVPAEARPQTPAQASSEKDFLWES